MSVMYTRILLTFPSVLYNINYLFDNYRTIPYVIPLKGCEILLTINLSSIVFLILCHMH